jgi:hypothetical protein
MRTQSGLFRGRWGNSQDPGKVVRVGQVGQSDFVALRSKRFYPRPVMDSGPHCDVFFLEIKATGKKPSADQNKWLLFREMDGFLTIWTDDLVKFQKWYRERFREQ